MLRNKFIKKIINEQFSDDPNQFNTQIDDVSFSGVEDYFAEYKGHDMDISYMNCEVVWRYDLDIRSWGIKDISIYTTAVKINAMIEIYDEDYTKVIAEKEIDFIVDDMGGFSSDDPDKWYYMDEMEDNQRYHTILPTGLDIDMTDKTVTVFWN